MPMILYKIILIFKKDTIRNTNIRGSMGNIAYQIIFVWGQG